MVHYIRFLKLPRITKYKGTTSVKALVTITTDLGDSFYYGDLNLMASIRGTDPASVYVQKRLQWKAHMRALELELFMNCKHASWPVRLHVGPEDCDTADYFGSGHIPPVISMWSDRIDNSGPRDGAHFVQRSFKLHDGTLLNIWEETGETIARHIW